MAVLFAMDMSASPNYGFATRTVPAQVTYTNAAGAGPAGLDALRVTHLVQGSHAQYTHGLSTAGVESQPAIGATRYHRLRYRIVGTPDFTANSGAWENKFLIFGTGGAESSGGRVILYIRNPSAGVWRWEWSKNVAINGPDVSSPSIDTWHALQVAVRSSSILNATDARLDLWHDNDDVDNPTGSVSGDAISTSGWGDAGFGSFADTTLATPGAIQYLIGNYEYATTFDATWFANMDGALIPRATPRFWG